MVSVCEARKKRMVEDKVVLNQLNTHNAIYLRHDTGSANNIYSIHWSHN